MASEYVPAGVIPLDDETGELDQVVICLRSTQLTCSEGIKPPSRQINSDRNRFRVPQNFARGEPMYGERVIQNGKSGIDLSLLNAERIAFLLPTLLLFPAWTAILFCFCEVSIHIWSHSRNFRSPFDLISSEFCAQCRTEKWMKQISKMQDKRSLRRNLLNRTFIKQVIR